MKGLSVILALLALSFADFAMAASAVVTSVNGLVQVQSSGSPPRVLRQGDEVVQGETVSTGANSSIVMKFDDGQIAALTQNSRMTVTAYRYDPANESGNVLLSLITGGMRTITGLIGRRTPSNVAYRAATATIGIRGTGNTTVTDGTNVLETVDEGAVTFEMGDLKLVIEAGRAVFARPGQPSVSGTIAQVVAQLPADFANAIRNFDALGASIIAAGPGKPRQGGNDQGGDNSGNQGGNQGGNGGGNGGGGGGNGGRGSPS